MKYLLMLAVMLAWSSPASADYIPELCIQCVNETCQGPLSTCANPGEETVGTPGACMDIVLCMGYAQGPSCMDVAPPFECYCAPDGQVGSCWELGGTGPCAPLWEFETGCDVVPPEERTACVTSVAMVSSVPPGATQAFWAYNALTCMQQYCFEVCSPPIE